MSSIRRLISSRLNAAKSTGPKTAAGKLRSSRNALRHGCRSRQFRDTLLPGESQEQFDDLLQDHVSALQPTNAAEHAAIRRIVFALWRARRLRAMETEMWNEVLRSQTQPDLISSYEILAETPGWFALWRHENSCGHAYLREIERLLRARQQKNRTNEATLSFPNVDRPVASEPFNACRRRTSAATDPPQHTAIPIQRARYTRDSP